jgi:uncharacterized membrane protein
MVDEISSIDKQVVVKRKISKETIVKIISVVSVAVIIIILVVFKVKNPSFSLVGVISIGIGVLIIGLTAFFFFSIYDKLKKSREDKLVEDTKVPHASMPDEIEKEIKNFLLKRMNHLKEIVQVYPFTIGKNEIYCYKVKLLYADGDNGKEIYIILNANYLKEKPFAIVKATSIITPNKLRLVANGLSSNPEETPDTEVVEEEGPVPGHSRKITRTTHKSKENENTAKRKEDIA